MAFGDKLKELLDEKEISQKEFAANLNIAATTLNGYIRNKRQPDFELVKNIAFVLGVTTDYLLDFNGDGINLTVKELSLISKLRSIDDEQKAVVYDLVDIIVKRNKA